MELYIIWSFILNFSILSIPCLNPFQRFVKPLSLQWFILLFLLVFMVHGSLILCCFCSAFSSSNYFNFYIFLLPYSTWKVNLTLLLFWNILVAILFFWMNFKITLSGLLVTTKIIPLVLIGIQSYFIHEIPLVQESQFYSW